MDDTNSQRLVPKEIVCAWEEGTASIHILATLAKVLSKAGIIVVSVVEKNEEEIERN